MFALFYGLSLFDETSNTFCPFKSNSCASMVPSLFVRGTSEHADKQVHRPFSFGKHLNLNLLMMARMIEEPLASKADNKTGSVEDITSYDSLF